MQEAHCETLVRTADRDRFLTVLFAPIEHRNALYALYAFNVEIARIRAAVRDPLAGEIRLQWWSGLLRGEGRGEVAAHPVAAALLATAARYRLPMVRLARLIEARRFDLYDEPMATYADFESYADGVASNLIALAAQVLADGDEPNVAMLTHYAGLAQAIAGLLQALPVHAGRGQLFVPLEILQRHGADREDVVHGRVTPQLRAALADMRGRAVGHLVRACELMSLAPAAVRPALLPVALTGPVLACMERPDYDPFVPVELASWRRQWLIWRAARRPSRIFAG
jgi:phytoene synthase